MVAEQQLPLPSDWLRWDEDAMEQAPSPSTSALRYSKEQRQGHEAVLVEGADDLCIEVAALITACDVLLCSSTDLVRLKHTELVTHTLKLARHPL